MPLPQTKLDGKLAVITGANSGIGLETCVHLAKRGCDIVMCCRNVSKAETAREYVLKESKIDGGKVHIVQLDLADLDNIGTFRERYDAVASLAGRPVDMLILNAGIMAVATRELTKQGLEAQMGTNVFGHFKFTAIMMDLCKAAPHSRIVSVSSSAHTMTKKISLNDINRDKHYAKWQVYSETKLGNLLFMAKLNKLLEEKHVDNVVVVGCHPGYTATNLQEHTFFKYVNYIIAQNAVIGSEPTVLAATDPAAKRNMYAGPSGMFELHGHAAWNRHVNKAVWNTELQDGLWTLCEEVTKCNFTSKL